MLFRREIYSPAHKLVELGDYIYQNTRDAWHQWLTANGLSATDEQNLVTPVSCKEIDVRDL